MKKYKQIILVLEWIAANPKTAYMLLEDAAIKAKNKQYVASVHANFWKN